MGVTTGGCSPSRVTLEPRALPPGDYPTPSPGVHPPFITPPPDGQSSEHYQSTPTIGYNPPPPTSLPITYEGGNKLGVLS